MGIRQRISDLSLNRKGRAGSSDDIGVDDGLSGKGARIGDVTNASDVPKRRPTTQSLIKVVEAIDNVLVLRDGTVVAAVGLCSIDDRLLSADDLMQRLRFYRNSLLMHLDFDVQMLLGTRPQNLDWHIQKLMDRVKHWHEMHDY